MQSSALAVRVSIKRQRLALNPVGHWWLITNEPPVTNLPWLGSCALVEPVEQQHPRLDTFRLQNRLCDRKLEIRCRVYRDDNSGFSVHHIIN